MFGSPITSWDGVTAAYYAGAGGEAIWLVLSIIVCAAALVLGSRHEKHSYSKLK